MATRSEGVPPSILRASTTLESEPPPLNMATARFSSSADSVESCSTAVWPRLNGAGWTTVGSSSTRTVSLPWLIAAGERRTAELITTVPVRLLTMTRAAVSAGSTSIISIAAITLARVLESSGKWSATVTPSSTEAVPGRRRLTASRTRAAVRKSASNRFQRRIGLLSKPVATARSTLAPSAIRPTVGMLTVRLEPSLPEMPRPPTARLPWAIA